MRRLLLSLGLLSQLTLIIIGLPFAPVAFQAEGENDSFPLLINTEIRLTELYCLQNTEMIPNDKDEPYIWVAWFKMDFSNVEFRIARGTVWVWPGPMRLPEPREAILGTFEKKHAADYYIDVYRMPCETSHGNIGRSMSTADSAPLDDLTCGNNGYLFRRHFGNITPIRVYLYDHLLRETLFPAIIGCVAVVWEEDQFPEDAVEAGYETFYRTLEEELEDLIEDYSIEIGELFELLDAYEAGEDVDFIPDETIRDIRRSLRDSVKETIKDEVKADLDILLVQLPAYVDGDDVLGTGIWYWSTDELAEEPVVKEFEERWSAYVRRWGQKLFNGTWELRGEVQAEVYELELDWLENISCECERKR